jgi:hypothetical protein
VLGYDERFKVGMAILSLEERSEVLRTSGWRSRLGLQLTENEFSAHDWPVMKNLCMSYI